MSRALSLADQSQSVELLKLLEGFELTMEAENKSPRTIRAYSDSVKFFDDWLGRNSKPTTVALVRRQDVEGFLADLLRRYKPATAHNRYRGLLRFFGWALAEEELHTSPMAGMRPPAVPEEPAPVLTEDQLRQVLRACEGKDFEARRDSALVRVFLDTGARLSEVAGLKVSDIDIQQRVLVVLGKGRRPRGAPFGANTALALNRYLRARDRHPKAASPALWLGHLGPMTPSGLADVVGRRGRQAGLEGIHPHLFRHTAAHRWQLEGGNETDLMVLLGWHSRSMLSRYAKSAAVERARESHRRLGLGDRL